MVRNNGQVAIEFFLYAGVFLFILLAAFSIVQLMQTSEVPLQESRIVQQQGENMAEAIRLAVIAGHGFQHNMSFPKVPLGRPYEAAFNTAENTLAITGSTSTGSVGYIYILPAYPYRLEGCLADAILVSNECSNTLRLENDGHELRVRQD